MTRIFRTLLVAIVNSGLLATSLWAGPINPRETAEQETIQETVAQGLRDQPEKSYEFNRASLRDVLRFLADDAGISFVSLPDNGVDDGALVTFTMKASPFRVLEVITKANGVALFYDNGVWYLRPYNDEELIGRTYKLQYNTQETVENTGASANSPTTASGGVGGTQSGGNGGEGGGTSQDLGLSLQGPTNIFKVNPNPMIKDIKALLGLPTDGLSANIAPDATVDATLPLGISPNEIKPAGPKGVKNTAGANGAQVIWNSDSNTLYVVATRQQHEWIEGYLASVDRPQNLIAIEVKFFETTKDPRKQLGVDWAGTLGEGFNVAAKNITVSPNGSVTLDQQDKHQSQSGAFPVDPATGVPTESGFNFSGANKTTTATFGAPYSAVLTAGDVSTTVRAFLNDRDTSTVSYPRVLTVNNREVVIRSVLNQPVLASSSSVTPGVGGTTTASVAYLPIGTIINILPKVLTDKSVILNVSITVSSIIGETIIGGNSYPIAASRVYTAELHVDSGYTLAIGGLEEAVDKRLRNGGPFWKDIPLLGEMFKSSDTNRSKKNLMIFITPTMLSPRTTVGISEKPESVIPVSPDEPTPPSFTTDGMLVGGSAALDNAVRWVTRRKELYTQIVKENRTDKKTIEEIAGILGVCQLLLDQISLMKEVHPSEARRYDGLLAQVALISSDLEALQIKARKDLLRF
jgi:type II secretory pathway component GspD/PulD (secretin)